MSNHKSVDICILGGGIGGCSTAHTLRHMGFKGSITILEQNDRIGGEARSGEWQGLPTEHCWRIYGPGYSTLFDIMKQIPLIDQPQKTVYDNLTPLDPYLVAPTQQPSYIFRDSGTSELIKYTKPVRDSLSLSQKWALFNKLLYVSTSSNQRLKSELSRLSWHDFINAPNSTVYDYCVRVIGPFYGVDLYKSSLSSIWEVIENTHGPTYTEGPLRVMNGPTSLAWFRHWHQYLQTLRVNILTRTQITQIQLNHNQSIRSVGTVNLDTTETVSWTARWYVLALPLQVMKHLLPDPKLNQLAQLGAQYMIGLQIYFSEKLNLPYSNVGIVLPESPWEIIIEPQGSIWDPRYLQGQDFQDVWSIGICDPQTPGWLHQKPFQLCTRQEVEEEVWYQIQHTQSLHNQVRPQSQRAFKDIIPYAIHLFDSYQWSPLTQKLETMEIKTSPNAGTWDLRPTTAYLVNAVWATSFTKTSREMILMDAAAEAGTRASCHILARPYHRSQRTRNYQWIFGLLRMLDTLLFQFNLPHLASYVGGQTTLVVFLYILILIYIIYKFGTKVNSLNFSNISL